MIADDLDMSIGFVAGVLFATVTTGLIAWAAMLGKRCRWEEEAFLRGRNIERLAHGEDVLSPAPRFEPTEDEHIWKWGVGS